MSGEPVSEIELYKANKEAVSPSATLFKRLAKRERKNAIQQARDAAATDEDAAAAMKRWEDAGKPGVDVLVNLFSDVMLVVTKQMLLEEKMEEEQPEVLEEAKKKGLTVSVDEYKIPVMVKDKQHVFTIDNMMGALSGNFGAWSESCEVPSMAEDPLELCRDGGPLPHPEEECPMMDCFTINLDKMHDAVREGDLDKIKNEFMGMVMGGEGKPISVSPEGSDESMKVYFFDLLTAAAAATLPPITGVIAPPTDGSQVTEDYVAKLLNLPPGAAAQITLQKGGSASGTGPGTSAELDMMSAALDKHDGNIAAVLAEEEQVQTSPGGDDSINSPDEMGFREKCKVSKENIKFKNTENCNDEIIKDPNELNNIKYEEVDKDGKGIYLYNDKQLIKKKIGGGAFGDVFRLLNDDNQYIGVVVKEFKSSEGEEDPEIKFVRENKDGVIKDCNLIHSRILPDPPQTKLPPVNFMMGVQGNLSDFRYNKNKMKIENSIEFLNIAKRVLEMLMCLECSGLRYTDLKDNNILYSCIPGSEGIAGIKVYMGDTGSIVEAGSDSLRVAKTYEPFWLAQFWLARSAKIYGDKFKEKTFKEKMYEYIRLGINSEQYVIFAFGILLIKLFAIERPPSHEILYNKNKIRDVEKKGVVIKAYNNTAEGKKNEGKGIQTIISNCLDDIKGRFDDSQNETIMNIIKKIIRYHWFQDQQAVDDAGHGWHWQLTLEGIKQKVDELIGILKDDPSTSTSESFSSPVPERDPELEKEEEELDKTGDVDAIQEAVGEQSMGRGGEEDEEDEEGAEGADDPEDAEGAEGAEGADGPGKPGSSTGTEGIPNEGGEVVAQRDEAEETDSSNSTTGTVSDFNESENTPGQYDTFIKIYLDDLKEKSLLSRIEKLPFHKNYTKYKDGIIEKINNIYEKAKEDTRCLFQGDCENIQEIIERYGIDTDDKEERKYALITNCRIRFNMYIIILVCLHLDETGTDQDIKRYITQFLNGIIRYLQDRKGEKKIVIINNDTIFDNVLKEMVTITKSLSDPPLSEKIIENLVKLQGPDDSDPVSTPPPPGGQTGGGKRRVRTNKKRKGRRANRTEKKNRRSIRKGNRRSRKKERTPKKRVQRGKKTPKKRTLKKRR